MNAATSELNHVGQALARESQRRATDHARFREELNSLKMGYDQVYSRVLPEIEH